MNPEVIDSFIEAVNSKQIYNISLKAKHEPMQTQFKNSSKNGTTFSGIVLRISNKKLVIVLDKKLKRTGPKNLYDLHFSHTRLPYMMSHQAIRDVVRRGLLQFLFPAGPFHKTIMNPIIKDIK